MARARRLAAGGAMVAFVIGGVSIAAGIGTATAESATPSVLSTCLPLPLIPCDEPSGGGQPQDPWSQLPNPLDSWSSNPAPQDSRSSGPESPGPQEPEPEHPWKPVDEDEHKMPNGHPETGGGALARDAAAWPLAVGGAALLTGAGLTGFAVSSRAAQLRVRRREGGA